MRSVGNVYIVNRYKWKHSLGGMSRRSDSGLTQLNEELALIMLGLGVSAREPYEKREQELIELFGKAGLTLEFEGDYDKRP